MEGLHSCRGPGGQGPHRTATLSKSRWGRQECNRRGRSARRAPKCNKARQGGWVKGDESLPRRQNAAASKTQAMRVSSQRWAPGCHRRNGWSGGTAPRQEAGAAPTEQKSCSKSQRRATAWRLAAAASSWPAGAAGVASWRALISRLPPSMAATAARQTASHTPAWTPGGHGGHGGGWLAAEPPGMVFVCVLHGYYHKPETLTPAVTPAESGTVMLNRWIYHAATSTAAVLSPRLRQSVLAVQAAGFPNEYLEGVRTRDLSV